MRNYVVSYHKITHIYNNYVANTVIILFKICNYCQSNS